MPAVRVDLGYLSNENEAKNLNDESHRDRLAAAVSEAIKEFFQPTEF
jgi:N-acetylmuramoyl-L-alanine amidase